MWLCSSVTFMFFTLFLLYLFPSIDIVTERLNWSYDIFRVKSMKITDYCVYLRYRISISRNYELSINNKISRLKKKKNARWIDLFKVSIDHRQNNKLPLNTCHKWRWFTYNFFNSFFSHQLVFFSVRVVKFSDAFCENTTYAYKINFFALIICHHLHKNAHHVYSW